MTAPGRRDGKSQHAQASRRSGWPAMPAWLETPLRLVTRNRKLIAPCSCLLGIAALVALVVYAVTGPALAGLGPQAVITSEPGHGTPEPVPQSPVPAQTVPVALPSTGAVPLPVDQQPQARTWNNGSGGAALTVVSGQAGAVGAALTAVSRHASAGTQASAPKVYAGMKTACAKLGTDVTAALAAPPIPDAAMERLYYRALSDLGKAASDCQTAISVQPEGDLMTSRDATVMRAAESAMSSASRELSEATGGIVALGRSPRGNYEIGDGKHA